jgi:carboxyl-terminal processing protease
MNTMRVKVGGIFLLVALAFGGGIYLGFSGRIGDTASAQGDAPTYTLSIGGATQPAGVDMTQFWRTWAILNERFVQTHSSTTIPTDQEKIQGAIEGLVASYGDPYTTFFPPVEAAIFTETISGAFGGVGMQLDQDKEGNIVVTAPLKDSPAQKAGVQTGDVVTKINATSTEGMKLDQAVSFIRGPKGTKVTLTFMRKGTTEPIVLTIVRDTINVPEIKTYTRPDGVFVIQLYTFTANSSDQFRAALREFVESGKTRLIFDLRGNPGGYLEAAVQMASYFLPVGEVVVTEDFKGKQNNVVSRSSGYNVFASKKLSMAILIDAGSASASEILAGALNQHGVAKLVGTKSFGKGSVQQLVDVGGGAQLKVTVARWLTPNGTNLSDGGLTPDIFATTTAADIKDGKDPGMDAAARYLLTQ